MDSGHGQIGPGDEGRAPLPELLTTGGRLQLSWDWHHPVGVALDELAGDRTDELFGQPAER